MRALKDVLPRLALSETDHTRLVPVYVSEFLHHQY